MKNPVWLQIIALIFFANSSYSQIAGKSIKINGTGYSLVVNKNGQLAISTNEGEVVFANSANGVWRKTYVNTFVNGEFNVVENACYFNADTALVWGDMYTFGGVNDKIYHTVNRGKTWQPVKFGFEGLVTDAVCLDNGEAWLNLEENDLAYTNDYGFTWTKLPVAFPGKVRKMTTIFFNNKRAGLIGSPWNVLAYTTDNCKHWTNIQTPYSQEKAKDKKFYIPPSVNRGAIYKDYLLVRQGNSVFYSKPDTVQWKPLPGYKDFYTDPENKALFFERSYGGFVKCDSSFQPVMSFDNIRNPFSVVCKNGSLYVLAPGKLWEVNTSNQLIETRLGFIGNSKPIYLGYYKSHVGNKIYKVEKGKKIYEFTLPFATDSGYLCMKDHETILYSRADSLLYYNIPNKTVTKVNGRQTISNFITSDIRRIVFNQGMQGCFGGRKYTQAYELRNNRFDLVNTTYKPEVDSTRPAYPDTINLHTVEEFLKKLPAIYRKQLTIDELKFSEEDYDSCKSHIVRYRTLYEGEKEEGEYPFRFDDHVDFPKMIAMVDSVKTIDKNVLNSYYYKQENMSTTHHWTKISFVNSKGETLEINNEMYTYGMYFPWQLKLNDLYSVSTAVEINQFINDVYPGFLYTGKRRINFPGNGDRRIDVLQELVKELYIQEERK